jgi:hypothetical protein
MSKIYLILVCISSAIDRTSLITCNSMFRIIKFIERNLPTDRPTDIVRWRTKTPDFRFIERNLCIDVPNEHGKVAY